MISEEVLAYVRSAYAQGATQAQVEQELVKAGWTQQQIADILARTAVAQPVSPQGSAVQSSHSNSSVQSRSSMEPQTTSAPQSNPPRKGSKAGIIITIVLLVLILGGVGAYMLFRGPAQSQQPSTLTTPEGAAPAVQQGAVDQSNAFDVAIAQPVLSDGQRLGSNRYQFSAVVPLGWGILATTSEGYIHFDLVNAQAGAEGGVIRISRFEQLYPREVTLKEIAEKEREDLKSRAEGFKETSFTKETLGGKEIYLIKAESTVNNTKIAIQAHLFLDAGRYYIVTGIESTQSGAAGFTDALATVRDSFMIAPL